MLLPWSVCVSGRSGFSLLNLIHLCRYHFLTCSRVSTALCQRDYSRHCSFSSILIFLSSIVKGAILHSMGILVCLYAKSDLRYLRLHVVFSTASLFGLCITSVAYLRIRFGFLEGSSICPRREPVVDDIASYIRDGVSFLVRLIAFGFGVYGFAYIGAEETRDLADNTVRVMRGSKVVF